MNEGSVGLTLLVVNEKKKLEKEMEEWTWYANESNQGTGSTKKEAQKALASAIGKKNLRGLIVVHGNNGEVYYYETKEDRDNDFGRTYAWKIQRMEG